MHSKTLVVDGITPVGAYSALRADAGEGSFLLESVVAGERFGRYSILGVRPRARLIVHGEPGVEPFERLARELPSDAPDEREVALRFARAHIGVVAYDAVHYASKVEPWPTSAAPIARFVSDATVVVFDHLTHTATVASAELAEVERVERVFARLAPLAPLAPPEPTALPADLEVDTTDAEFEAGVTRVKAHILAGDTFQVVLARTFSAPARGAEPFDVYRALRVLSPSPYMFLLELPERPGAPRMAVAGASPETLVRVAGGRVTVRPIAGTRRRGRSPDEDDALARELLADPKELAEHVMLIDLARNDVGRVARPGSVQVPERLAIERFSHVMHLVSEVSGELRADATALDALRAAFPAGTLSGAPKVRAMQLIRELEPRPRGVYGGAVGYLTRAGELDFAIAIRTVVLNGDAFEVTAGAGVVEGSVPALEAKETRNKARAALAAIRAAQLAARFRAGPTQ
ncbi:MAG: anthranilate synthase component I family protein [Sorangiineae bacterium]|nr:anthranilate synthase component I family protein [Polyangiaceae bacterium]MEB2322653.1 anthranilate synthase component I family protein [Sorangiineae bacterium]